MNTDLCSVNPTVATYSSLRINKCRAARVDMENQRNGCMCLVAAAAARLMAMLCADPTSLAAIVLRAISHPCCVYDKTN